jgi:diadenylate cyclase
VDKDLGTRHRAAIGITEETDAVVIVVSEETGGISVVLNGRMTRNLDGASLRRVLLKLFPERAGKVRGLGTPGAVRTKGLRKEVQG